MSDLCVPCGGAKPRRCPVRRSVWAELCSTCRSIIHASELVKRCHDTVTPLRNLSLDKNDTSSSVANRSAARRRASRAPTMAAAAEIDTILSNVSDAVQAYAAGHHDAALRAAPAPAVPRPIWAQAPEEVEQLLAGAILRDAMGVALVAASPIIVQAPDAHGVVAPHVCIHTSAAGTALLAREVVQRFAVEYLPRVGLPGYVSSRWPAACRSRSPSHSTATCSTAWRSRRRACSTTARQA